MTSLPARVPRLAAGLGQVVRLAVQAPAAKVVVQAVQAVQVLAVLAVLVRAQAVQVLVAQAARNDQEVEPDGYHTTQSV